MNRNIDALKAFLDQSYSMYHAVAQIKKELEEAGYTYLPETKDWELLPGGKYYVSRGGSAVVAFRVPKGAAKGFMISSAHTDRPAFKVKENGELIGKYTRVATEKYGGMLIGSWLDRPLSIAGRVLVDTPDGASSRLVNIDKDLLLIPNVAIHMNRTVNDGYKWNPAVDTLPLAGSEEAAGKLMALLEQTAGGKILGHDLYLYIRQKASVWGIEEEYLSAAGLDDLSCVWCCTQGFLQGDDTDRIPVLCLFDSEEVGSASVQGAASTLLENVLARVCAALDVNMSQLLGRSFMVSADNAHAIHPNHPELSDEKNAPVMGQGVVLKFNANQNYTTDGISAAIFRKVCQKAQVSVQTYYNRADLPGGSTLGRISLGHVSVLTADVGIAQLAMHSCYETLSTADVEGFVKVMQTFYSSALEGDFQDSFILL